jgi:hypothetical protein
MVGSPQRELRDTEQPLGRTPGGFILQKYFYEILAYARNMRMMYPSTTEQADDQADYQLQR